MEYSVRVLERTWLNSETFELTCTRPEGFAFAAGQHVRLSCDDLEREYTIVSATHEPFLRFLIKRVPGAGLSARLAEIMMHGLLRLGKPTGYLTFQPTDKTSVFIATGVGVAPFVAMAASGVHGFILLQGARDHPGLFYRPLLEGAALTWVGCLSGEDTARRAGSIFHGRVSTYVSDHLPHGNYTFYLCGSRPMIHDMTHLLDERYPAARVYSEAYS